MYLIHAQKLVDEYCGDDKLLKALLAEMPAALRWKLEDEE